MKSTIIAACVLSFVLFSCNNEEKKETATPSTDTSANTTPVSADAKKDKDAPMPQLDSATKMKNWMAYATPGDVHKMLAAENGNWTGEMNMWQAPGAPPTTAKVNTVTKMILGGRYQVSTHTGNMMGMPFEGIATTGYDNATKKFTSTWIDNMGTGFMTMQGTWDEATKTITFLGEMVNPETGDGRKESIRETFQTIDSNTMLMTMYGNGPDGKEMKIMEIKYSRK